MCYLNILQVFVEMFLVFLMSSAVSASTSTRVGDVSTGNTVYLTPVFMEAPVSRDLFLSCACVRQASLVSLL